jgi:hypothetical protein
MNFEPKPWGYAAEITCNIDGREATEAIHEAHCIRIVQNHLKCIDIQ